MPIVRFMTWVGTSLLALLFVADWYLPKPLPESAGNAINRPVIRIASVQEPPERIIIDTSQPTIVPPPTLFTNAIPGEPSRLQSYASAGPPSTVINVGEKRRKVINRQGPKLALNQPPFARTPAAATPVPLTKLSFVDIISGVQRNRETCSTCIEASLCRRVVGGQVSPTIIAVGAEKPFNRLGDCPLIEDRK